MTYETRVLSYDHALGFLANMRWFAGLGRVVAKKLSEDRYKVRASTAAWSYWVD